jgi:hypothetical protein
MYISSIRLDHLTHTTRSTIYTICLPVMILLTTVLVESMHLLPVERNTSTSFPRACRPPISSTAGGSWSNT